MFGTTLLVAIGTLGQPQITDPTQGNAPAAGAPSSPPSAASSAPKDNQNEPPKPTNEKQPGAAKAADSAGNTPAPSDPKADSAKSKSETSDSGSSAITVLLDSRCRVAFCFNNNAVGIEPLIELPIGKSFSLNSGGVSDYVNNHDLKIDFAAGLRVWIYQDWLSFAVYLSKPLSDRPVRIPGSSFEYPSSALRRPYPGVALGLLFDSLWVGLDRDELRNPDSTTGVNRDPTYPPNALVGASWTVTVALQPITAFRTGIGVLAKNQGGK